MSDFTFNISLSVLNHLGRNLYRSIVTVLGEAISNSWDADAENVFITIDRDRDTIIIRDDGEGMDASDFQNKFLKIGYSKRKQRGNATTNGRPFIGSKGIGKLALLSCAKKVSIISRKRNGQLISGVIDNTGLDKAIKEDVSANDYTLEPVPEKTLQQFDNIIRNGTALIFSGIVDGIKNRVDHIGQLIALYFRFSIVDSTFKIYLNDEEIGVNALGDLTKATQFLWTINNLNDIFVTECLEQGGKLKKTKDLDGVPAGIQGFFATVDKPSSLKINGTDEKVSVDLFVNGRLREKDILRHIPSARIVENYLYGQIHFNDLDDGTDRFTSSREGVVSDDPLFVDFMAQIESMMRIIIDDWDRWRLEIREPGDPDNPRMKKKARKTKELVDIVAEEFVPSPDNQASHNIVKAWIDELSEDAGFNVSSYTDCFVSENLLRKYIKNKSLSASESTTKEINKWKERDRNARERANISFNIREDVDDWSYCGMNDLAYTASSAEERANGNSFVQDAKEYGPIRDAVCHTARLTSTAKARLNTTYENIKARVIQLLNEAEGQQMTIPESTDDK